MGSSPALLGEAVGVVKRTASVGVVKRTASVGEVGGGNWLDGEEQGGAREAGGEDGEGEVGMRLKSSISKME